MSTAVKQDTVQQSTPESKAEQALLHGIASEMYEMQRMMYSRRPVDREVLIKCGETLTRVLARLIVLKKINEPNE
jgi:hypothetical protein